MSTPASMLLVCPRSVKLAAMILGLTKTRSRPHVLNGNPSSCKLHGPNPFDSLRDLLVRIGEHLARDVLALSPKGWKQAKKSDTARDAAAAAT